MLAAGVADCEERDGWFLSQDVNAWTSLAYVAVGIAITIVVVRRRAPRSFIALGAVTALEGIGSMLYHGTSGDLASSSTTQPSSACSGSSPAGTWGGSFDPPAERAGAAALAGLATGLAIGAVPGANNVAVALLAAVVMGTEVLARRRGLGPVWSAPLLVARRRGRSGMGDGHSREPALRPPILAAAPRALACAHRARRARLDGPCVGRDRRSTSAGLQRCGRAP